MEEGNRLALCCGLKTWLQIPRHFFPLRIGVYGPSPWIWEHLWLFWRTECGRSNALWFLQLGPKKLHAFCFVGWNILSWILSYGLRSWLPWGHMLERPQGEVTWQSPEKRCRDVCVWERERENKRPVASSHSNHTSPDTRHEHGEGWSKHWAILVPPTG